MFILYFHSKFSSMSLVTSTSSISSIRCIPHLIYSITPTSIYFFVCSIQQNALSANFKTFQALFLFNFHSNSSVTGLILLLRRTSVYLRIAPICLLFFLPKLSILWSSFFRFFHTLNFCFLNFQNFVLKAIQTFQTFHSFRSHSRLHPENSLLTEFEKKKEKKNRISAY